jgi:hypothetical protein
LFARYRRADWYAREAPTSRCCPHGYEPKNIDEAALSAIANAEGLASIRPFNAGVCLLNNRVWERFAKQRPAFLDTVWRLLVGRHQRDADGSDDHIRSAVLESATRRDHHRAIPYPSNNFWIAEEIALWLTLGRVHGITQDFLSPDHVIQDKEFIDILKDGRHVVVAHYFSLAEVRFFRSVRRLD